VKTAAAQDQEEKARVLAELYWMAQADDETARLAEAEADARILAARVLAQEVAGCCTGGDLARVLAQEEADEKAAKNTDVDLFDEWWKKKRVVEEAALVDVDLFDEIHTSVRDGVADATNWVEEGHGNPVVLGILANKLNQTRTQFLRNVIEGLRKSGSPMEQQTDELETLCRYIKPKKWSNRVDGIKGLAIIVREFCVLMPGLYIQFVSRLTHHQLDCLSTKKAEPDMRIFITDQGYALDESDSMLANCGEGKLRGTPKDLCYMCYEEEPEPAKGKAFSRCRSSVCAAANIAPHALMCPRCLQTCPIARFRCLPIPIVREGRRQID
jgi:hypothetical protein